MESVPDVSVIMPVCRSASDIAAALDSVYSQTFSALEVIVVNDGSPDTPALVAALSPYASRIRYIQLAVNRGAAVARNTGIAAARGRYIAFLDADHRWFPAFLERQVRYLDANAACQLVCADRMIRGVGAPAWNVPGAPARRVPEALARDVAEAPAESMTLLELVQQRCTVILSTVVVRRQSIVTAGLFDEGLRRGQDFDLWLRLALRGAQMVHQPHILAERVVCGELPAGEAVAELERILSALERFGRRHLLDARTRTALRIRTMQLVDRLEIEQGKLRILEGNFAAAQYHLAATRERPFKLRLAIIALRIAPRLVRAVYVRGRNTLWGEAQTFAASSR
jgi:glycosyltransferase involved in cell wall biosynthesis